MSPRFSKQFLQRQRERIYLRLAKYERIMSHPGAGDIPERIEFKRNVIVPGLHAALRRMDEGTYGECIDCGIEIDEERLGAIPGALRCLECAEQATRYRG